jgi:enoyl-CoA hydratase
MPQWVHVESEDHVATVTLQRGPVNAMHQPMYEEVKEVFDTLSADEALRVVILTGGGEKAFQAGNDVEEFLTLTPENAEQRLGVMRNCFRSIYECPVPVIAAVNGPAIGTGLALAAEADFILASENAFFLLPEIDVGIIGGARHAFRMFPQMKVRRMFYTAEKVTAHQAYQWGAIEAVIPQVELLAEATKLAKAITRRSPLMTRYAKKSLNKIEWLDLREGYEYEQSLTAELSGRLDPKEAVRAYLDKREPDFLGQ